jgi:alkylation response protein AidB-like acyl-CoA dehydrogenase
MLSKIASETDKESVYSDAPDIVDDSLELLRASVTDFLSGRKAFAVRTTESRGAPEFDLDSWRELAELGWLGLSLPESRGGAGFGTDALTVVSEQLGRAASAVPYIAASVLPSVLLGECEPDSGVDELTSILLAGQRPFCLAWQDHVHQWEGAETSTVLKEGRVSGAKRFVVGAELGGILLVSAQSPSGMALVAVDSNAAGVRIERYAAGLGSEGTVYFDQSPVFRGSALASEEAAARALSRALQIARVTLSAQLAGLASGSLERTVEYIGSRVQFGRPISSFQSIRHRCVDLLIATRLAHASWAHAARCIESEPLSARTAAGVSAAKARCGDVAVQAGRDSIQMHGAMGCTEEAGVGLFLRAAVHGRGWLGSPLAHRRRFQEYRTRANEVVDA